MELKLEIDVLLRKSGPAPADPAEEVHVYTFPFGTPQEQAKAVGAYEGIRSFVQDLDFKYRGAHYGVIVNFQFV